MRTAHPEGILAVLDMVGDRDAVGRLAALVHPGGHVVSMLGAADTEGLAPRGITGLNVRTAATTEKLDRLASLVDAGSLRRPSVTMIALGDAGQALAEVAGRHVRGKLVVEP